MIPHRAPVKALLVGEPPQTSEVVDAAVLGTRVNAEAHARALTTAAPTRLVHGNELERGEGVDGVPEIVIAVSRH
jgi:hypothetical protein